MNTIVYQKGPSLLFIDRACYSDNITEKFPAEVVAFCELSHLLPDPQNVVLKAFSHDDMGKLVHDGC